MQVTNIRTLGLLAGLALLLPAGCAKAPGGSSGSTSPASGPQVFVTMTVAGNINPSFYYFVLFNVNNTPGPGGTAVTGPIPVVAAPYGNGFAAGAFTNYVEYHGGQPGNTDYGFYAISPDLLQPGYLGSSGYLVQTQTGSSTISFQIPLADLATPAVPAAQIQRLEINLIATNVTPPPTDMLVNKYVDSLYPTNEAGNLNRFIDVPTTQSGIFQNSTLNIESSGDVTQYVNGIPTTVTTGQFANVADLDITDFSVRVSS